MSEHNIWDPPSHILYMDFETFFDPKTCSLKSMTLPRYLAEIQRCLPKTRGITGLSVAVDDGDPVFFTGGFESLAELLSTAFTSDDWAIVAHNAAFDVRVARACLDLPQPKRVWCSMELAMAAWPNQPGGYSLANLANVLNLQVQKQSINLAHGKHTPEELADYCNHDVLVGREILNRALPRIDPREIQIEEAVNRTRELFFHINPDRVSDGLSKFVDNIRTAVNDVFKVFGRDPETENIFGRDGQNIKSVKPHVVKDLLLDRLGFETQTISKKKVNIERLRRNPKAADVVEATSAANKNLWYKRALARYSGGGVLCCELGAFRAHTFRFSSPQAGDAKGLNLHNMPKHNKSVAMPIRKSFEIEDGLCLVRVDLANVEYRIEGWLAQCWHVEQLFLANLLADPYAGFWEQAVNQKITKKDPIRQVAKMSVLGLGYLMGIGTWISTLLRALADPFFNVGLKDLEDVCRRNGWSYNALPPYAKSQGSRYQAPWEVVTVAYYTRELFHKVHPEFMKLANWLLDTVASVSSAVDPSAVIDRMYDRPNAPDRNRIDVVFDPTLDASRSVRVKCGNWSETVTWRDIGVRDLGYGPQLTSVQSGNKGYRYLTKNILIENITQSCARNALCAGLLELERRGHSRILHIHDEIMLVVPTDRAAVLNARDTLLDVYGAGNSLGYDWAVAVDPGEVSVTKSLWEDEDDIKNGRWDRIEQNVPGCLDNLP